MPKLLTIKALCLRKRGKKYPKKFIDLLIFNKSKGEQKPHNPLIVNNLSG